MTPRAICDWGYKHLTVVPLVLTDYKRPRLFVRTETVTFLSKHTSLALCCSFVPVLFFFSKKKQGSKTIKVTRKILKTQCASVCLFMPAHTTKKNKTHFFILWHCACAASAQCSMHRSLSFSTHPYTHTHTHIC